MYLLGIIAFLTIANIIGMIARYGFGVTSSYLIQLFNVDNEHNIPSLYSSLQLLSCGAILFIIAYATKLRSGKDYWFWIGLGCLFMFLGIDEAIEIHERVALFVRGTLNTSGVFYFAWIIPYGLLVIGVAAAYIPFLLRLPPSTKKLMIISGIIYVAGALGMEAAGSYYHTVTNGKGLYFAILTAIEEPMEMLGIALFLFTLLHYVNRSLGGISLTIGHTKTDTTQRTGIRHGGTADRKPVRAQNTFKANTSRIQAPDDSTY